MTKSKRVDFWKKEKNAPKLTTTIGLRKIGH